tara:strand:+ start:779 stop:1840 length:1062 start_codon:yes stop_codon:yes gene_type:complete
MIGFLSNTDTKSKNTGNYFYISNIINFFPEKYYLKTISSFSNLNLKRKFFYFFLPFSIILNFLSLFIYFPIKSNNKKFILATFSVYSKNVFYIKKHQIKTYLMIDSLFDYYYNKNKYNVIYVSFAYFLEVILIFSGLETIILNSTKSKNDFISRYSLFIKFKKINIKVIKVWCSGNKILNKSTKSSSPFLLLYGNFLFHPNIEGLKLFLKKIKKQINYKLVVGGTFANSTLINKFSGIISKKFTSHEFIKDLSDSRLEELIQSSSAVIIVGEKCEGIKLKIVESLYNQKIVILHKNLTKYFDKAYQNMVIYTDDNLNQKIYNTLEKKPVRDSDFLKNFSEDSRKKEIKIVLDD